MDPFLLVIIGVVAVGCIHVGIKYENFSRRRSYFKRHLRSAISYKKDELSYIFTGLAVVGIVIFFLFAGMGG